MKSARSHFSGVFVVILCCVLRSQCVHRGHRETHHREDHQVRNDVLTIIQSDPRLEKFADLIRDVGGFVPYMLERKGSLTVFAPSNEALENTKLDPSFMRTEQFISYHISNTYVKTDSYGLYRNVPSEMRGSLPLWLWMKTFPYPEKEYYVNNAKVIQADIQGMTEDMDHQVLHIIDDVLEPIIAKQTDSSYNNPDALKFMANLIAFNLHKYQLDEFSHLIERSPRRPVFTSSEGSTYFMPVNSGFTKVNRSYIDNKVIDIHVIFDRVLFTRGFGNQEYDSYSNGDSVKKVQLSLINETSYSPSGPDGYDLYIQSNAKENYFNTIKQGVIVAKILKANIPIKNGVVHIIDRPLVAAEISARELIEDEKDKRLSELYQLINSSVPNILEILQKASPITFFAPSNEAFHNLPPAQRALLLNDSEATRKLLELHIVPQSLHIETIAHQVSMSVTVHDNVRKLALRVLDVPEPPFKNYTVEGGGVNATIITPNIIAKNGVVHIINRVLGIPVDSMSEMLKNDDDMSLTFKLGQLDYYNEQFRNMERTFTYFVPNDEAWGKVKKFMPSEYRKLYSSQQTYHAHKILDRHLTTNGLFNIDSLVKQKNIRMVQGEMNIMKVQVAGSDTEWEYWIEWKGEKARIVRPDVRTTNGIIHVIDNVLMERRDMTYNSLSSSISATTSAGASLLLLVLSLIV